MKYIKLFENVWDDWVWEEEEEKDILSKLKEKKYIITFDNIYECIDIAKKLKKLKNNVYNYEQIIQSRVNNNWNGFSFISNYWTRIYMKNNIGINIISYYDFMNL